MPKPLSERRNFITADHILIACGGRPSHPRAFGRGIRRDSDGFFALSAFAGARRSERRLYRR